MDQNYDSSSGDDDYAGDPQVTLQDIEKSKTIHLSIRANYTNWDPREAFRELVQNWYVFANQLPTNQLPFFFLTTSFTFHPLPATSFAVLMPFT